MSSVAAYLLLLFVILLLQALFNGYETGFVSTNPIRIRFLAEETNQPRAGRLLKHISRPDRMLTTLLIGTNLCMVAGALAAARILPNDVLVMIVVTPIVLVAGEIIPKSVFRIHPNRLSLALLPFIEFVMVLLSPIIMPITWLIRMMFRMTGSSRPPLNPLMSTLEDMRVLVDESAAQGTIEREEQRMIHSVMGLQDKQAKEIMVPRIDIQALPENAQRSELIALFEESGCTRIPVYQDSVDTIIGVVRVYDILLDKTAGSAQDGAPKPETGDIRPYIKEVLHVPDTMRVDDLLQMMRKNKQHMVIVTDEYGGTDGLITLEDILEQIFGDIQDEHDREESSIQHVGPDAYVVDARTSLEELSRALDIQIEDPTVETVGGWVMRAAGCIPHQGKVIQHLGFRITILESSSNAISKIRLEVLPEARTIDANKG